MKKIKIFFFDNKVHKLNKLFIYLLSMNLH